jgi:aspartate kinase
MIVMKFGGTSVESAAAIERVAAIVKARWIAHPVVVVSAMGKTTNKLLAIANAAIAGKRDEYIRQLHDLRDFHSREARQVVPLASAPNSTAPRRAFPGTHRARQRPGRARRTHAALHRRHFELRRAALQLHRHAGLPPFRHARRAPGFARRDRHRHRHTRPRRFPETYKAPRRQCAAAGRRKRGRDGRLHRATEDGVTTTLGRGGSDFTASIVGAGIGAEEIQIWTDVDGMLTADPTILPGGHRVKTISFAEAAELAYFGAKVLHPATVIPAVERNIPVLILNSRRPDVPGTRIVAEPCHCRNAVKSIACKRKITLVNIHSTRMLMAHGFLRRIFEVFDRTKRRSTWWRRQRSQRVAHHRQHPATIADCGELSEFAEAEMEPIRPSCAWWARTFATLREWRAHVSMRSTASTSA